MLVSLSLDSSPNLSSFFLSLLFRRRNTQTWSYREEPTTLVSICFQFLQHHLTVTSSLQTAKTQTLNTSLNSVIMEDTAVFVVVLELGIVLSKLRKPEPPAGGPKQICLLIWEIVFKPSKTNCWRENRSVDAVAEHVEAGHLLWTSSRLRQQQHQASDYTLLHTLHHKLIKLQVVKSEMQHFGSVAWVSVFGVMTFNVPANHCSLI